MKDRIIFFGDRSGINPNAIRHFIATTQCSFEGNFPCPVEERAKQIMEICRQKEGLYHIIDSDPIGFAKATRSIGLRVSASNSITVIKPGSTESYDKIDDATGLRIVSLPYSLSRFPTHPTPSS